MSSGVVQQFPVEEEFKKPTGVSAEDVRKMREWLKTQPHLPGEYLSDLDLVLAFRVSNASIEVAKQSLDTHFTLKTAMTNFFKDRTVDEVEKTLNVVLVQPLHSKTKEGYAVMYMRFLDLDPKNYNTIDVARTAFMIMDLWQYEEGTWPGFVLAIDLEGSSFSHLTRWEMQTFQQFIYYLQEGMFISMKGFHFLNAPAYMDRLLGMIKTFMKKSRQDILHVHQAGAKLDEYLPVEDLPKEAGGKYKTYEEVKDEIVAKLKANREYFAKENKKRVVEERRPADSKCMPDVTGGVVGSFKKLDID